MNENQKEEIRHGKEIILNYSDGIKISEYNSNSKKALDKIIKELSPNYSLQESLYKSIRPIITKQLEMQSIALKKIIEENVTPMQKIIESLMEKLKPITEHINEMLPYFSGLSEIIEKLEENPDSIINWDKFSKEFSSYFWLPPYMMNSDQILEVMKSVHNEKELDDYLDSYFEEKTVEILIDDIITRVKPKHKEIMNQINACYKGKNYALVNTGLFSIIDSLCSFFVTNKKYNTYRINLFKPILNNEKRTSNYYNYFLLSMVNNNINFLYGSKKGTHKLARRHLSQHGEFFSNSRIETILLLHTVYYLLLINDIYSNYEKSLDYVKRKKGEKEYREYILINDKKRFMREKNEKI